MNVQKSVNVGEFAQAFRKLKIFNNQQLGALLVFVCLLTAVLALSGCASPCQQQQRVYRPTNCYPRQQARYQGGECFDERRGGGYFAEGHRSEGRLIHNQFIVPQERGGRFPNQPPGVAWGGPMDDYQGRIRVVTSPSGNPVPVMDDASLYQSMLDNGESVYVSPASRVRRPPQSYRSGGYGY